MTKKLYAHILLDRSGSMDTIRDSAISAVNEYLNKIAVTDTEVDKTVSLTTFDDISIDQVWDRMPPRDVKLSRDSFVPRGMTPLLDAIGQTVAKIDGLRLPSDHLITLVIVTDGLENRSVEFRGDAGRQAIKKMLAERQDSKNWLVIYLAAGQDAIKVGESIGTRSANTMSFDTANIGSTMGFAAHSTRLYTHAGSNEATAFTDDQRRASMEKKKEDNSAS